MEKLSTALIYVVVIVAGVNMRLGYLNYGLPYVFHADELTNYNILYQMVNDKDPNPHFFRYPSLLF